MKNLLLTLSLALVASLSLKGQVLYSEDFDGISGPTAGGAGTYSFAPGMLKRNVDNRTPNAAVSYVNEAWERREDFSFNVADSCAFSTSWYTPVGAADDWMWTPLVGPVTANTVLNWNAVTYDAAYPDGYEVRIMTSSAGPPTGGTGVLGNQVSSSTVVASVAAENTTWTARSVSLAAYAGQSIYVGFRNTSNDKFILLIDDIVVMNLLPVDAQLTFADTATEYTLMPQSETTALNFTGIIRNNGTAALAGVSGHVNVWNGATNVYSANSAATASLAVGATTTFTIPGFTPSTTGNYTVEFIAQQTSGTDLQTSNDTLRQYFVVTDSTYARDDGTVLSGLGIGAGNGGYLGQDFSVPNTDLLTSIGVYYTRGYVGRRFGLAVWSMSAGVPNAIVAVTDTLIYPDDSARYYTVPMFNGPVTLAPGSYAVTAIEFDSTISVGLTMSLFTVGHTWVNWPTSPFAGWANNEDFGGSFQRSYVIRPNFGDVCLNNTATASSTQATCVSCADGSATVTTSGTDGALSYAWSPAGGNAATATGLLSGTYMVTVTDGFGCVTMDTVFVSYDVCGLFTTTTNVTSTSCAVCSDGSAGVVVSGDNGGLNYSWSNGGTSDTIQNVLPGNYTVIVVDTAGCSDTLSITIGFGVCGSFATSTSSTNASCGSCADGSASVVTVGNNGSLTYLWSNGGTSDTIQNVLPGTYYVTVTDSAGCTSTDTVVVQFGTAVAVVDNNAIANVYPNPSNGAFQVDLNFAKATDVTITVVNVLGEVVATQKVSGATKNRVDLKINSAPGIYSVRVTTADDEMVLPVTIVK